MTLLPRFKIAQKLPLALIGSALIVGLGIGAAAYLIGLQTVEQQRQERMDASIQSGLDQVQAYFDNIEVDLKLFATRADTVTQIENMTRAFTALRSLWRSNSGRNSCATRKGAITLTSRTSRPRASSANSKGAA